MSSDSSNDYEVLEKIGHGSFGVIRKVRRKIDNTIVCRKEVSYLKMSQKEREQLHAEFTILSSLRHPNIVGYYHRDHLKSTQDLYIYMEYCGNGDLGRVIRNLQAKNEYADEAFVWSTFSQILTALYRCHYGVDPPQVGKDIMGLGPTAKPQTPSGGMTILHRDLKPENIFLGEDNSVKLGDFGLSKVLGTQQFASTYVGTPFYMSPEICAAETYTLKSDIWSLGCIIYELCTREPPFNAKTHYQLVQKIKEGKIPPLPNMYSPELTAVIRDCLRVNPDRRPDTAALLNLPVVRLMRKEREVVETGRALQKREMSVQKKEDSLLRRTRELEKRLQKLDVEKSAIRQELDASLRREWEVKARLEIDRMLGIEMETLQGKYEEEVQARVQVELRLQKRMATFAADEQMAFNSSTSKPEFPFSSIGAASTQSGATAETDMTEYSRGPDTPKDDVKKAVRTPFLRAQTMYVGPMGTPMDVDKFSPSPCAISSLSLSPRRKNGGKPMIHAANIFANDQWRKVPEIPDDFDTDPDDESDEVPTSPSPTRKVKKVLNAPRPGLAHTNTAPEGVLKNKPILPAPSRTAVGLMHNPDREVQMLSPSLIRERGSANRQLSKIPSFSSLPGAGSDPSTRNGLSRKTSMTGPPSGSGLVSKLGNIRGRTLVELTQARSGGRVQNSNENAKPAVWDPNTDEMPSPFLVRSKHIPKSISGI